ncbi:MAG: FCD domain-containing protein [Hyphomicrobiales bacterium]|nr:MAG: FCD domain-containing protein [Hyphomicrobiales bacterium]
MSQLNELTNGEGEHSAAENFRRILLDRILKGELTPGERINENQLAAEFQTSRGPIREALRTLEQANLVEVIHNRGVFVRKLDIKDALHLYDVRAALAYMAGKLLGRRATAEQIQTLRSMHEAMEQARLAKDAGAYAELNERFHATLMQFTGNPRLIEWAESIDRELRQVLRGGVAGPSRLRASNDQHLNIIEMIDSGDAQAAALAFEEHITSGKARALDSLLAQPSVNVVS